MLLLFSDHCDCLRSQTPGYDSASMTVSPFATVGHHAFILHSSIQVVLPTPSRLQDYCATSPRCQHHLRAPRTFVHETVWVPTMLLISTCQVKTLHFSLCPDCGVECHLSTLLFSFSQHLQARTPKGWPNFQVRFHSHRVLFHEDIFMLAFHPVTG